MLTENLTANKKQRKEILREPKMGIRRKKILVPLILTVKNLEHMTEVLAEKSPEKLPEKQGKMI